MIYKASVEELDNLLADVEAKLEENDVSPKITMPFLVAVEEIFVNIASYAYTETEGNVDIELTVTQDRAHICFTDEGIAFDPLAKEDPDINAPAEERQIGGLGIYMVKKTMDGVKYERVDDKNVFSFWKNI